MSGTPRATFAQRLQSLIVNKHFIRFHMGLILSATTVAGVGSSKLLLEAGLGSVRLRYPLAVLCSYLVFLGLIKLWITWVVVWELRRAAWAKPQGVGSDVLSGTWNGPIDLGGGGSGSSGFSGFGGGDSGGAGASDSWGEGDLTPLKSGGGGGGGWFPDLDLDGDDVWLLVLLAGLVLAILGAGGYLIWAAPHILPDLAVNAAMGSFVTNAAKKAQADGSITGALRSTCLPFLAILVMATVLSYGIHSVCPGATRLMEAFGCPAAN